MKRTVISDMGTAAILIAGAIPFTVRQGDFKANTKPTLTAQGLAGSETVTLVKDGQICRDGVITASSGGCVSLDSPGEYSVYKSSTAATVNILIENSI